MSSIIRACLHRSFRVLLVILLCALALTMAAAGKVPTQPGYTLHFNFLHSADEARQTVDLAKRAGALVVSVVPPAHLWEDTAGLSWMDALVQQAHRQQLGVILSRADACQHDGTNWLYAHALTEPGRMPDGSASCNWFCATVGNTAFEQWQVQETAYYAKRYGHLACLRAAAIGGLVEPFVSQRGSLLQFNAAANSYEIAQYTSQGAAEWHRWLQLRFHNISAVNKAYGTTFPGIGDVPMPGNDTDARFAHPREAYFDLVRCMNDWVMAQYQANRQCWHRDARAPFLLQLSGFDIEKLAHGYPEFAAFDLPSWLQQVDGIGLSLYTYAGYPDWGHASDMAMIRLIAGAKALGKPVYIMESGCEAPEVTLQPHELSFVTRAGLQLSPRAQIYEYFRYQRDGRFDPGMMVSPQGTVNQAGFNTISDLLTQASHLQASDENPCLYYLSLPDAARANTSAGLLNRTVYSLTGYLPCRILPWKCFRYIPAGTIVLVPPGLCGVLPPAQLHVFLQTAYAARWVLVSDGTTSKALKACSPKPSVISIPDDRWLQASSVEQSADSLFQALRSIPAFQRRVAAQPVEPRAGVYWFTSGHRLYLWVDDARPVVFHQQALRNAHISQVWCSNIASSLRQTVVWRNLQGREITTTLLTRQWQSVSKQ